MLPPRGTKFSKCLKFCAIAERGDKNQDRVGIYYAHDDWKMLNRIDTDTLNIMDIFWVENDSSILVIDNPLEPKILCYNVSLGTLNRKYSLEVAGRVSSLAVRSVQLSPDSAMFATGLFDNEVSVYRFKFEND